MNKLKEDIVECLIHLKEVLTFTYESQYGIVYEIMLFIFTWFCLLCSLLIIILLFADFYYSLKNRTKLFNKINNWFLT
jgi:hypothetical protein